MRKKICLLLAAALVIGLTACGGKDDATEATTAEVTETVTETGASDGDVTEADSAGSTEEATEEAEAVPEYSVPDEYTFDGAFKLKILGYEYFDTEDKYEYNIVNIYYDFTNITDGKFRGVNSIYWHATQDGEELKYDPSSNITFSNMDYNDNIWFSLQTGVTIRGYAQFACKKDSTSPISVGAGEKNEEYPFTFDVYPTWEMPDMRSEKFEFAKVDNPSYGPGNIDSGSSEGKYDIKINGIKNYSTDDDFNAEGELVKHNIVGIEYTITNNSERATNPFMLMMNDNYVFQDGASLIDCGAGDELPEHGVTQKERTLYQDLEPGQTSTVVVYYKLRSDSPIEVVFKTFLGTEPLADMVYELELP